MFVSNSLIYLIICFIKNIRASTSGLKPNINHYQNFGRQVSSGSNVVLSKAGPKIAANYPKAVPVHPKDNEVPHLEVMDFFVPSYPYSGDDFEMTCGYKHDRRLTFHRIEWHRNKVNTIICLSLSYIICKMSNLYEHALIHNKKA